MLVHLSFFVFYAAYSGRHDLLEATLQLLHVLLGDLEHLPSLESFLASTVTAAKVNTRNLVR